MHSHGADLVEPTLIHPDFPPIQLMLIDFYFAGSAADRTMSRGGWASAGPRNQSGSLNFPMVAP